MFSFVKSATIIVGKQRTAFLKIDKGEDEKHETQTDHIAAIGDIDAIWDGLHSIGQPRHNTFDKWAKHGS